MVPGKAPRLIDTATGKTTRSFEGHIRPVTYGAVLARRQGGRQRQRRLPGSVRRTVPGGPPARRPGRSVPGTPRCEQIARHQFPSTNGFNTAQFSPDGNYLVVVTGVAAATARSRAWATAVPAAEEGRAGRGAGHPGAGRREAAATRHAPADAGRRAAPGGRRADRHALDKLAEELPKSNRPAAQQID